jgi:hypothetical protein
MPSRAAKTTPTPRASSPAPGCTSSGIAGRTAQPTTPPGTKPSSASSPKKNPRRLDTGLLIRQRRRVAGGCEGRVPGRPPAVRACGRRWQRGWLPPSAKLLEQQPHGARSDDEHRLPNYRPELANNAPPKTIHLSRSRSTALCDVRDFLRKFTKCALAGESAGYGLSAVSSFVRKRCVSDTSERLVSDTMLATWGGGAPGMPGTGQVPSIDTGQRSSSRRAIRADYGADRRPATSHRRNSRQSSAPLHRAVRIDLAAYRL